MMVGLVLMGVLLAPYFLKFGAYSVSRYLGARFDSRILRVLGALLLAVPCLLFLIAEIQIGAKLTALVVDRTPEMALWSFVLALIFMIIWGGVRGLIWTNAAQGIVSFMVLLVLPMIAAILLTNLPLPQITYGTLLGDIGRMELQAGVGAVDAASRGLGQLLGSGMVTIEKPFLQAFGSIGRVDFILIIITIAAGIAAAPHLLTRSNASPGVSENRRSLGWACLLLGLVLLTLPAVAVFVRYLVLDRWVGLPPDQLPQIALMFVDAGYLEFDPQIGRLGVESIRLSREAPLLIFPAALGLPDVFTFLLLAGVIALALAAASAQLMTVATLLTVDVAFIGDGEAHHSFVQTAIIRVMMVVLGGGAGWVALNAALPPVDLFFYALQFSAGLGFPVLVMSVWWKRINSWGAIAAMLAGAGVLISYILFVGGGIIDPIFGIDPRLSAIFAMPIGLIAGVVVSTITPSPSPAQIELVRDMRLPGGEALYDRKIRFARLKAKR